MPFLNNKSLAAVEGSLRFPILIIQSKVKTGWTGQCRLLTVWGEQGPLCQRSLWCRVLLASPKQKPEYAAESLTAKLMRFDVEYS